MEDRLHFTIEPVEGVEVLLDSAHKGIVCRGSVTWCVESSYWGFGCRKNRTLSLSLSAFLAHSASPVKLHHATYKRVTDGGHGYG